MEKEYYNYYTKPTLQVVANRTARIEIDGTELNPIKANWKLIGLIKLSFPRESCVIKVV